MGPSPVIRCSQADPGVSDRTANPTTIAGTRHCDRSTMGSPNRLRSAAFRYPQEHDEMRSIDQWPKGESEMSARTPAPKAQDYSVVPGSLGPRRDFRISVGLREGWDADGRVFDVSEAVRTARAWMKRRVEAGQPALSGMFARAEVTYAWPRPDGTVGSDREPVALFTGEAVHAYLGHLSDETIEAMLNELSIELGAALGQERIYVAFANRTWILDAGERLPI